MKIGYRIKDLRTRQRVTLKDLAKKTGLTTSFLSQLERDLTSPSVHSLEKMARALNTNVAYFFEGEKRKELIFVKRGTGQRFIGESKRIFCETLASSLLKIKMLPQLFTIGTAAGLTKELVCPEGEKFGMVLKGRVEFACDEEKIILAEGDSIYCAYTQKLKGVKNIGRTEAKLLWVVFSPD